MSGRLFILLGCFVVGAGVAMLSAVGLPRSSDTGFLGTLARRCDPAPQWGTTSQLDGGTLARDGRPAVFELANDTAANMVAIVRAAGANVQALAVASGGAIRADMPQGRYALVLMSGSTWCNLDRGFKDGVMFHVPEVSLKPATTTVLKVRPGSSSRHVSVEMEERGELEGSGSLELRRGPGRHYTTSGAINGVPVRLLLDTGASQLSLPERTARAAGIACMQQTRHSTAGGMVGGCAGVAGELRFGPFRLTNVEVSVLPALEEPLLGMNVLSRFHMEWHSDRVRISAQHGGATQSVGSPLVSPVVPWPRP